MVVEWHTFLAIASEEYLAFFIFRHVIHVCYALQFGSPTESSMLIYSPDWGLFSHFHL